MKLKPSVVSFKMKLYGHHHDLVYCDFVDSQASFGLWHFKILGNSSSILLLDVCPIHWNWSLVNLPDLPREEQEGNCMLSPLELWILPSKPWYAFILIWLYWFCHRHGSMPFCLRFSYLFKDLASNRMLSGLSTNTYLLWLNWSAFWY